MFSLQNFLVLVFLPINSSPRSVADSDDLFEANQLSKRNQYLVVPFSLLWTNPFIDPIILFIETNISPISWRYFVSFKPYFNLCISKKNNTPVTEHSIGFSYLSKGLVFFKIYGKWGKFLFDVIPKWISPIDLSSTLSKIEAIFLHALLKPSNNNLDLHH